MNNTSFILSLALFAFSILVLTGIITAKLNGAFEPQEKIVHVMPEKMGMACVIYKVDDAFVIIINDKELSKNGTK